MADDKVKVDALKVRIEELDRNFFSLRDLEWRITLQFLSAYAAVGIGYHSLLGKNADRDLLAICSIILLFGLFLAYCYFRDRLRERLVYVRRLKSKYLTRLHKVADEEQDESETDPAKYEPKHPNTYAANTQLAVHIMALASAGLYILKTWHS